MKKRVVVTGLGIISPIGNDVSTFWENLLNGVSGVGVIKAFDTEGFPTRIAAEVLDFDPLNYFNNKESKRMDRVTMLGIAAAQEAIDLAETHRRRFQIELAGLGQMQRLAKIVHLEQRLFALTGNGCENRGVHQRKAVVVEKPPNSVNHGVSNATDAPRSQRPQV